MIDRVRAHHGPVAQALHWLTAIVVLIAFIYGPGGSEQRVYSAARDFDRQLHETLGLAVLALVLVRLAWRAVGTPPQPVSIPRWMEMTAKLVQVALYVLMLVLPATAIAGAWLEGHPLTLLGAVEIGSPIPESHRVGAAIAWLHTWLGDAIMWLAGAHALAALYHHFVLKDGVLASMLPRTLRLRLGRDEAA
jgi:cytochrome b561